MLERVATEDSATVDTADLMEEAGTTDVLQWDSQFWLSTFSSSGS